MLDEAIAEYEQALAIGDEKAHAASTPGSPLMPGGAHSSEASPLTVRLNLADALARKGRPEVAIAQYRAAVTLDPLSSRARANLGATLGDLGRFDEGRDELEKALRIDPAYGSAHINLAAILAQTGDTETAALHYQAALSSDDERVRRAAQSGLFLLSQGAQ
jgi:tetratricopeptide (TPR) repeat protein